MRQRKCAEGAADLGCHSLEGNLADSVSSPRETHSGNLVVTGAGELARDLITRNLVDEFWFT